MESSVLYTVDGPVALVTLDAAERENRLDPGMVASLEEALAAADADPEVRILILRASGRVFSNGMDLGKIAAGSESGGRGAAGSARDAISAYSRVLRSLSGGRLPTLCAVDAPVRAGGVGLAAACDIVIASENASFELSEVRFGIVPANVLPYLLGHRMSPQRARYLVLSGKRLDAREAERYGLADEVCSAAEFEKVVRATVKGLLRSSPAALETAKRITSEWPDLPRSEMLDRAIELLESIVTDPGTQARLRDFENGGLPPWFARYKPTIPLSTTEES